MGTVVFCHEIVVVCGCGLQYRFDRTCTGIAYRPRWQTAYLVCVVGGVAPYIAPRNLASKSTCPVDCSRIALQWHPFFQAVEEDRGDQRFFLPGNRFFLDNRGEGNYLAPGQVRISFQSGKAFIINLPELADHQLYQGGRVVSLKQVVGAWVKVTFDTRSF